VAEAALEALFGAVLAIVTLNAATNAVLPRISNALSFLSFEIPHNVVVSTYVILIVVGVLLGLLGSAIAMRRYLRV
jgi:cell division transport system permease protein